MERHKRLAAAALAASLLLAACSADADGEADAGDGIQAIEDPEAEPEPDPVEPEPETDPIEDEPAPDPEPEPAEPAEIDITVIPDEITEEYVEAVFEELERLYAEAFALYIDAGELTIDVNDRMGEAFTEGQREARIREFDTLRDLGYEGILASEEIRPRDRSVIELIQVGDDCLFVETIVDFAGVLVDPPEPELTFVLLTRQDVDRPVELNSSDWVFADLKTGDASELRTQRPC